MSTGLLPTVPVLALEVAPVLDVVFVDCEAVVL